MNSYTEEMLSKLQLCSTCKKAYYLENGKICDNCKERSKMIAEIEKSNIVLCSKNGCKYKKSIENIYCKLHQLELWVDEVKAENKKMCLNYIRGCREKLDKSYSFSRCEECLLKEREKDRNRRGGIKETNKEVVREVFVAETEKSKEKGCTSCFKTLPIEEFAGIRKEITETCKKCRENQKIQDQKRDLEHRNEIARRNDAKPERIEVKKQWKEENYEKVAGYWMNSRQHKIDEIGVEEYLKMNAEQAKKWRDNNPEKMKEININKINSLELQYNVYIRTAELKNLEFKISFDEYTNLVKQPCHYCGIIQNRGVSQFNGIDRDNSEKGYILENCLSSCKICNYMKKSLDSQVFIDRIEHILTYNKIIDGKLYPELFGDHKSKYNDYRLRALKKQLDFLLMETDFKNITNEKCYICGKGNSETHRNGIDRYDNNIGYRIENCKPCCGECNYMKREYPYDKVFDKFKMIYEYNKKRKGMKEEEPKDEDSEEEREREIQELDDLHEKLENAITFFDNNFGEEKLENTIVFKKHFEPLDKKEEIIEKNISIIKSNKKTQEEIKEANRLKVQRQRERLKEKYGDEEYKKMHAKKIAEYRAKRRNNNNDWDGNK
jgi:hypothetical protein